MRSINFLHLAFLSIEFVPRNTKAICMPFDEENYQV